MTDDIKTERRGDILLRREGAWGLVTLSREKALNSLTAEMCEALDVALTGWAADDEIRAVLIEGAGERAFCAGGDIRWLASAAKDDPARAASFFRREYRMNTRIQNFRKPYVALMDGITMGGGVGISAGASHRVVTDATMWAMPECGIGLIPDVGASHHLKAVGPAAALYLGLTGARLRADDLLALGLADAKTEDASALRERLLGLDLNGDAHAAITDALPTAPRPDSPVLSDAAPFEAAGSLAEVLDRLEASARPTDALSAGAIRQGSPTSLKLTWRLLTEAPETFEACIAREFRVAAHLMEGPDFLEGVRAQVLDKDRNPRWSPDDLGAVTDAMLDRYFEAPEGGDLDLGGVAVAD